MSADLNSVWCGAVTDTSVWVRGVISPVGADGVLHLADNEDMTGSVSFGTSIANTEGQVSWQVTGLDAGTRYWYTIETGTSMNLGYKASFRTLGAAAGEQLSYTFGAAGDAGLAGGGGYDGGITDEVSNSVVFNTMRAQSLADDWAWFSHLGDLHYRNIDTDDADAFRQAYRDNFNYNSIVNNASAYQGDFLRQQAITYVWDDHDFGANNSDSTSDSAAAAQSAYREIVPHYTLDDDFGIWQSWQAGRVLYIASDSRSYRDPNDSPKTPGKTMLGSAQKAWMETLLTGARDNGAEALVWHTPSRWLASDSETGDTWNSFSYERDELIQLFGDTGWLHRMIQLTADKHSLAISTGPNNPFGRFPIFMFASMDCGFSGPDPLYDLGCLGGRKQYGTVQVQDNGHTIALKGTGWIDGVEWKSHTAYIHAGSPVFALDYSSGHVSAPLEPTDDDQNLVNDVTSKRDGGGEAHYVKDEGPLNIQDPADDPDGVGVYDQAVTLTVAADAQLPDQASWRVHQGTYDAPRYPMVHIDLAANPDLADEVTALSLGDRMTIANPPEWLPPDTIDMVAEGGTETIGLYDWDAELNASPGGPWTVAQLLTGDGSTAGSAAPCRLDTSSSVLLGDVDEDATTLDVLTVQDPAGVVPRARWINSDGPSVLHTDHFPFDVRLGGEVVRVTACAPLAYDSFARTETDGWGDADSGHTWTPVGTASDFSADGSSGIITLADNKNLHVMEILEPLTDCEILVSITPSAIATGAAFVPGVLLRASGDYYRCRMVLGLLGSVGLDLVRVADAVGSGGLTPASYTAGTKLWMRVRITGQRVLARAWQDSVDEPVHRWHLDDTVTDDPIDAGAVGLVASTLAGNTNTAPSFAFDDFQIVTPQRMTVTRSVNGVVKAQADLTPVALAQPAVPAL